MNTKIIVMIVITIVILIVVIYLLSRSKKYKYTPQQGYSCRGSGTTLPPESKGYVSVDKCQSFCDKDSRCTAFDVARPNGSNFDCYLHFYTTFNNQAEPQSDVTCYMKQK
jgi:hypothetical protein